MPEPPISSSAPNEATCSGLRIRELTKRFPSRSGDVIAVDHVSFDVNPGEVYGLLGPNGAGKTTTLRMLLGLLPPTSGYSEVAGFRSAEDADEVKRRVGLVSANTGLYSWLTPREYLLFFADLYGVPPELAAARLEGLKQRFALEDFLDRRCAYLSTGQKQRVNLARALIHSPPIMLLDEPTRGLDVLGSHAIFEYIADLRSQGKAIIVCTHRLDEAARLCDRFGLLNRGQLRNEGTLTELRREFECESLAEMFLRMIGAADPKSHPVTSSPFLAEGET